MVGTARERKKDEEEEEENRKRDTGLIEEEAQHGG